MPQYIDKINLPGDREYDMRDSISEMKDVSINDLVSGQALVYNGTNWVNAAIPTVNNATLTIKRNGTSLGTFTANSSTNTEVDISVPSAPGTLNTTATTAQSTNSSEALSGSVTLHKVAKTGTYSDLIGTPTIPTVNDATLTIQKNGTTVNTFTANASSNVTANISVREVPAVTSSDSGKFLIVNSNGSWEAQELKTNIFYTGSSVPSNSMGNNGDIYLQSN